MTYELIPEELRLRRQWVCAGKDKAPRIPGSAVYASVTDPGTWRSFEEAVNGGWPYIGFVFSQDDPYTFIDLDNKEASPFVEMNHLKRIHDLQSYTERSIGGSGYHIIVKGAVPRSYKTRSFEIYASLRFAIFTGDAVLPLPIADRQEFLSKVVPDAAPPVAIPATAATQTDEEVLRRGERAANGEKFKLLWEGQWKDWYPSQSEADFALVDLLMFYSRDVEQTIRLFRQSGLGQRAKAQDDRYALDMAQKAYAMVAAPVVKEQFKAILPPTRPPATPPPLVPYPDPPGTLALLQDYIYHTSTMPIREISLTGALAFMAGVVGRQYNINKTGLNLYFLLLGDVGVGKEGAKKGISRVAKHVEQALLIPEISQFVGPGEIASGVAMLRYLADCHFKCFLSVISEFGEKLSHITSGRANPAEQQISRILLDLYSESGKDDYISDTVYADVGKNIPRVKSPAMSVLGVATPSSLFGAMGVKQVHNGLVSRFTLVHYRGERVPLNASRPYPMPPELEGKLAQIVKTVITMYRNETHCEIQMTREARALLDAFEKEATAFINQAQKEHVARYVWNRAHLKALRLAGLAAAADNPNDPAVTIEHAMWAVEFTRADIHSMLLGLEGEESALAGADEAQVRDFRRRVEEWLTRPDLFLGLEKATPVLSPLRKEGIIPRQFLSSQLSPLASFRNTRSARQDITSVIEMLLRDGELVRVPLVTLKQRFNFGGEAYQITEQFNFSSFSES